MAEGATDGEDNRDGDESEGTSRVGRAVELVLDLFEFFLDVL